MPALEGSQPRVIDEHTVYTGSMTHAEALRRLYNAACSLGRGKLSDNPMHIMSLDEAERIVAKSHRLNFDWLGGRVLKVILSEMPTLDVRLYDRDNGKGAAARALGALP